MSGIVEIGFWRLLGAYMYVLLLVVLLHGQGIAKSKEVLLAALRMTLQMIVMGYVLVYIFELESILVTFSILIGMQFFAIKNIFKRVNRSLSQRLRRVIVFSMLCGTISTLLFFLLVVIGLEPWYAPRYFIPIAGMIVGNSMTGAALGTERLLSEMEGKKDLIEGALMLGATPEEATSEVIKSVFTSAIMPTINTMVGMGIVFLPGMMTGQILSGVSPLVAIEYQIAITLGILGSVSITVYLLLRFGCATFFNQWQQLVLENDNGS